MRRTSLFLSLLLLALLTACTEEIRTPGEPLRVFRQTFPPSYLNEEFSVNLRTVGGRAPYTFELESGDLPPGLTLQGGTLRGTPTTAGRYTFRVRVSDANLSRFSEEYTLEVTEPPPATLRLNAPTTEMREPFTIRVEVLDARDLQALRTLITWDAARFTLVADSVRSANRNYALFSRADAGSLNVDMAVLGTSLTGVQRVFEFTLQPVEPSTIELNARTEFRSAAGRHGFSTAREGIRPTPLPTTTPPATTPPTTPPAAPGTDGRQGSQTDDSDGDNP